MSPLFSYNGLLLAASGALAASDSCCCAGCDCYIIEYSWNISEEDCNQSLTGTLLVQNNDIKCYNASGAISGSRTTISYGQLCAEVGNTELFIDCGNEITTIGLFLDNSLARFDIFQLFGNLCCGDILGEYVAPAEEIFFNQSFSMTVSLNNIGNCNCSGYNPTT